MAEAVDNIVGAVVILAFVCFFFSDELIAIIRELKKK